MYRRAPDSGGGEGKNGGIQLGNMVGCNRYKRVQQRQREEETVTATWALMSHFANLTICLLSRIIATTGMSGGELFNDHLRRCRAGRCRHDHGRNTLKRNHKTEQQRKKGSDVTHAESVAPSKPSLQV